MNGLKKWIGPSIVISTYEKLALLRGGSNKDKVFITDDDLFQHYFEHHCLDEQMK